MTPERAQFHVLMIEAGDPRLFDIELAAALEAENPLSDLTLALSLCSTEADTLHTLREHLLDHPADMTEVERMVRAELRIRLERGELSPETCLQLMHTITYNTSCGDCLHDLYPDICAVEEYRDQVADGIISEEAYLCCLDALMKAEPIPDVWKLEREIRRAKRRGENYPEQDHPGVLTIPEEETISPPNKRRPKPMQKFLRKFIGDKAFYKSVLIILLPLVVQQGITSAVNLLDNLMVGSLGEESLSAVSVVNQILMVFNLTIFGGLSGVSIFGAQFAGKGDVDGMRQSFRAKLYFVAAVVAVGIALLAGFDETFIGLFLAGEVDAARAAYALSEALDYLHIMLWGLLPFALVQSYAGSMREMGKTVATMAGSIIAILTNLVLNFLLIYEVRELTLFGWTFTMWGAGWGVRGAAIATVIARFVEMIFVVTYAHLHKERYIFLKGAYRNGYVPLHLLRRIAVTGTPLMLNEVCWSLGMTFINQCYSTRGMTALAALNITSTAWNLFCIIMFAMGNAVSIMVGQCLGQGDKAAARDTDNKLLFITVVSHILLGGLLVLCSGVIPTWFEVTEEARALARQTLIIAGAALPIHAFLHATYFTIRSGGKTFITFLFDSVYTWCVPAVLAFCLSRFTDVSVVTIYFGVQFIDVVKLVIGLLMLRSDFWANNIVSD